MTVEEKKQNVLNVFNLTAQKYVEYFGDDWEFKKEIDIFINKVIAHGKVIDLGCGSGYISNYMKKNDIDPIGIDFSEKMIEIATNNYPQIPFYNMDFADISDKFLANSIDGLLSIYSLYFIPREQMDQVLNSLSKVAKNKAPFLIVTQIGNGETLVDEALMPLGKQKKALFVNLNTQDELIKLLEKNHFSIESLAFYPNVDADEIPGDGRLIVLAINNK